MSLSGGQRDALDQLKAIERAAPGAVEITWSEFGSDEFLRMDVSLDCSGVDCTPDGIALRERERLRIVVGPDFPFDPPLVFAMHGRWAGKPHVQWAVSLCLYAAPSVEWDPSDGMYGFLTRLWLWLEKAAVGELDPDDVPLHPPVDYTSSRDGVPLIVPRADTPTVTDTPWIGGVELAKITDARIDLVGWNDSIESWLTGAAPAVLLPGTLDFEYPRTIAALLVALEERGVVRDRLLTVLKLAALGLEEDEPLIFVLGSAMRGTAEDRRQHLSAWYIPPVMAWGLAESLRVNAKDDDVRARAQRLAELMSDWAEHAKVDWCPVREDRPEVTRRRDLGSPMEAFQDKHVSIWGCGALGAPIAEWVARSGARKITLYDKAKVTPGVLVRQPFVDIDIGKNKARVVARRLREIRPRDLQVEPHGRNVLTGPLGRPDWHDGADIVIDATASVPVASKLEAVRRTKPQAVSIVSLIVGHTAQHVCATIAPPGYSGAGADLMRQVKLSCGRQAILRGFLNEFWPVPPRTQLFQPEPGCSDPTFTGSGAEVAALAASALTATAGDLGSKGDPNVGSAHLLSTDPGHPGARQAHLKFRPAQRICSDDRDEIRLSPNVRTALESWIRSSAREVGPTSETGGLLFGERDAASGVIWVDEILGPPPDSRRSPELFICGTEGVAGYTDEKAKRGRGSLEYVGMWHTHPTQEPMVSRTDLDGIRRLLDATSSPLANGLLLIVGNTASGPPVLGTFQFSRDDLEAPDVNVIYVAEQSDLYPPAPLPATIGIALSGGGSRAIAFHLGCLRALHDRGILQRTRILSSVSGGSVIAAAWAFSEESFEDFDTRITDLLRHGLQRQIARRTLLSIRGPQALGTTLVAGGAAGAVKTLSLGRRKGGPPLRRWISRTDAFADVLERRLYGDRLMQADRREGLDVVINACELTTGSAFRFGSRESGCWRTGKIIDNDVGLATAVAASAAYPLALPALDRRWSFERRDGSTAAERIQLTDGGVYENLGTSCLEPGRSHAYSYNQYDVDYIIACDAGRGLLDARLTYSWLPRVKRSFEASFRKLQDGSRGRLHALVESGDLEGFIMPYLGQQDAALAARPADLVPRSAVADYPTDFRAMKPSNIAMLSRRGEQLTQTLLDMYLPQL